MRRDNTAIRRPMLAAGLAVAMYLAVALIVICLFTGWIQARDIGL